MSETAGHRPSMVVELPFAPSMQEMVAGQSFVIEEYGVKDKVGENLTVDNGQGGKLALYGVLESVRIYVGDKAKFDYLDVTDVSAQPWYDAETGLTGNFALIRWSHNARRRLCAVDAIPMIPGRTLTFGRPDQVDRKFPVPLSVDKKHVSVTIDGETNNLIIENHSSNRTDVWNMAFGLNYARDPITKRTMQSVPYLGHIGLKKDD